MEERFHNFLPHIASSETLHKSDAEPYIGLPVVKKKIKLTLNHHSALANINNNDDIGEIYNTDKR